jgi:hypothetical protein
VNGEEELEGFNFVFLFFLDGLCKGEDFVVDGEFVEENGFYFMWVFWLVGEMEVF